VFGLCFQISHVMSGCDTSLLRQQTALEGGFGLQNLQCEIKQIIHM
jgi:hypothetical protein